MVIHGRIELRQKNPAYEIVDPLAIDFDDETTTKSFGIKNNIGGNLSFRISEETGLLNISPKVGQISPFGSQIVSISLDNRDEIDSFQECKIIISIADTKHIIHVSIDKGKNAVKRNVVTRGLQAFYSFDGQTADDIHQGYYPGELTNGSFITDTPNSDGKSLKLLKQEYVTIKSAPLDGRQNYSVSLWVKDFGTGPILSSLGNGDHWGATLYMTEEGKLLYCAGQGCYNDYRCTFSTDLSSYMSDQWIMLTIVTTSDRVSTLYVNGRKAASGTVSSSRNTGALSMCIGGKLIYQYDPFSSAWADPMKIDNVRLYSVALTDEEIQEIYYTESK